MPLLPDMECPTITSAKGVAEFTQKDERRDYLGASLLGHPCSRHIWYEYHGYPRKPFGAETLWNFEDGHRTEAVVIQRLKQVPGVEVWDVQPDGRQYGFSALGGKLRGHLDGVIKGLVQAPKTPHVLEVKACGQKKWDEFKRIKAGYGDKLTLEQWNPRYYVQAQLYMHYFQLNRHYLVVAMAGGRDMDACRTEYKPEFAERQVDKADRILQVSDKPDYYECRWCPFREECHGKGT
jgi:hypothetical protein